MKKIMVMLMLLLTLISSSVLADVVVLSNETSNIETERASLTLEINETGNVTSLIVSSNSDLSTPILSTSDLTNADTFIFIIGGLTGDTTYYWQMNGSSNVSNTDYSSSIVSFNTNNYAISSGITRLLMGIFVLIALSIEMLIIFHVAFQIGDRTIKGLITRIAIGIILMLFLNKWIITLLVS